MFENLSYVQGVTVALEKCMGIQKGEEVLIVSDSNRVEIANTFSSVAASLGGETIVSLMAPRETHGAEPPRSIAEAMKAADVVMIPTSKSLTHTSAREEANKAGARIASMPSITKEILAKAMAADYEKIKMITEKIAKILTKASNVNITTKKGTNLRLKIEGRKGTADTGMITKKGEHGNLPAGEAFCAPLEGKTQGKLVVDIAMAGIGKVNTPIEIDIEKGEIIDIRGGAEAREFQKLLERGDENSWKTAELGIGTNEQADPMGNILNDEKLGGTIHVAFGDNSHFGGVLESITHLDGIVSNPTLKLDDKTILERGQWQI